jgi:hypothetical protein
MFALAGKPAKSCRSPFREDRHASFSVSDDGFYWHDFATSESGDAISFLAKINGISNCKAVVEFLKLAGEGNYPIQGKPKQVNGSISKEVPPYRLSKMDLMSMNRACERLVKDPGLASKVRPALDLDAIQQCAAEGDLGFASLNNVPSLLFCYSHGIKVRQPDKRIYWQSGLANRECWRQSLLVQSHSTVYITEGEIDALRLISLGFDRPGEALVVALPSATAAVQLEFFRDKRVVLVPDHDEPGMRSAGRLSQLLAGVAQQVSIVKLKEGR